VRCGPGAADAAPAAAAAKAPAAAGAQIHDHSDERRTPCVAGSESVARSSPIHIIDEPCRFWVSALCSLPCALENSSEDASKRD
jgi:hypothetical protein